MTEIGLWAPWALDLTTVDPEDGFPCDFDLEAKRKRAADLLERDRQAAAAAGCMSEVRAIQWPAEHQLRHNRNEVKEKLRGAMVHVKFALDMCLRQCHEGSFCLRTSDVGIIMATSYDEADGGA